MTTVVPGTVIVVPTMKHDAGCAGDHPDGCAIRHSALVEVSIDGGSATAASGAPPRQTCHGPDGP